MIQMPTPLISTQILPMRFAQPRKQHGADDGNDLEQHDRDDHFGLR